MAADQPKYTDPDSGKHGPLSDAPSIDPTAQIRDTVFGRFNEIGARTRVAELVLGDYAYIANDIGHHLFGDRQILLDLLAGPHQPRQSPDRARRPSAISPIAPANMAWAPTSRNSSTGAAAIA